MTLKQKFDADGTTLAAVQGELDEECLRETVTEIGRDQKYVLSRIGCGDYILDVLGSGDTILILQEDIDEPVHADIRHLLPSVQEQIDRYNRATRNVRLTNGEETFLLGCILQDQKGPVHGTDSRGYGYTRCDIGDCDHAEYKPFDAIAWHDDENTETLWEVK